MKKINKKIGTVIRKSGDKTVLVETQNTKTHPIYEKKYQIRKRYLVSDPDNSAKIGAQIEIIETAPKSKRKRWEIVYQNQKSKIKDQNDK